MHSLVQSFFPAFESVALFWHVSSYNFIYILRFKLKVSSGQEWWVENLSSKVAEIKMQLQLLTFNVNLGDSPPQSELLLPIKGN